MTLAVKALSGGYRQQLKQAEYCTSCETRYGSFSSAAKENQNFGGQWLWFDTEKIH